MLQLLVCCSYGTISMQSTAQETNSCARHQLNLCGASDGGLPLAWLLKHTLAIHAHLGLDQANL